MFRIIVPALVFLMAGNASAKDLNILTGAGMSMPVKAMAADFGARTGAHVTVVSDTAGRGAEAHGGRARNSTW